MAEGAPGAQHRDRVLRDESRREVCRVVASLPPYHGVRKDEQKLYGQLLKEARYVQLDLLVPRLVTLDAPLDHVLGVTGGLWH